MADREPAMSIYARLLRDAMRTMSIYARLLRDAMRTSIDSADPHPADGHVHSGLCQPYEAYAGPILQGRRGERVTPGRVHA